MSFITMAPSLTGWAVRGALLGGGIDLLRGLSNRPVDFRNLVVNLIHGLALGIIGNVFGAAVACGAFVATLITIGPAIYLENMGYRRSSFEDTNVRTGLQLRVIAVILGSICGKLF